VADREGFEVSRPQGMRSIAFHFT